MGRGNAGVKGRLPSPRTKRLAVAFTAVFPLPNRSYDRPIRGFRSFQFTASTPGKERATGTNCVGGTFWSTKAYTEKNPETVTKFSRAIAKAVMVLRTNKDVSVKAIKEHLGLTDDKVAGAIWDELHNVFGAELPKDLFREIFESRRLDMIAENQWPKDKPLPDPEQFLLRAQLDAALKSVNYVPAKVGTN